MKILKVILIAIVVVVPSFMHNSFATECTADNDVVISENLEKTIVREASGRPIGYIVQEGNYFSAYIDTVGWLDETFDSIDSAVETMCTLYDQ